MGRGGGGAHPAFLLTAPPACQVNTQMCSERASLAQVVRQEFAEQLAASQEETQRVKAELAELRARQQVELDEVHRRWVLSSVGGVQGACPTPSCLFQISSEAHGQALTRFPSLCQEG